MNIKNKNERNKYFKKKEGVLEGHTKGVNDLQIVYTLQVEEADLMNPLPQLELNIKDIESNLILSCGDDEKIKLWDLNTLLEVKEWRGTLYGSEAGELKRITLDPEELIQLESFEEGDEEEDEGVKFPWVKSSSKYTTGYVECMSYRKGKIATGNWDATIRIYEGVKERILLGHTNTIYTLSFNKDGSELISGGYDRVLKIWDVPTGRVKRNLVGHTYDILSVAYSKDEHFIVSGSWDTKIKIWDKITGQVIKELKGHTDKVTSVQFIDNDKYILSGSWDRTLRVWDVSTGEELARFRHPGKVSNIIPYTLTPNPESNQGTSLLPPLITNGSNGVSQWKDGKYRVIARSKQADRGLTLKDKGDRLLIIYSKGNKIHLLNITK